MIIILSFVLVYSVALCFISILARKSVLNDITFSNNSASAQMLSSPSDEASVHNEEVTEDISAPVYYQANPMLEELVKRENSENNGLFAPVTTIVELPDIGTTTEEVTTAPNTETEVTTTTEKAETTATTTTVPETTATTTTTLPEEEVFLDEKTTVTTVDDDESIVIDDDEEDPVIVDEDEPDDFDFLDEEYIQSIIQDYYDNLNGSLNGNQNGDDVWGNNVWGNNGSGITSGSQTPGYFPDDQLQSVNSYHDDVVTVYDKTKGRYVTDNAFDIVCAVTYNEVGTSMHPEAIKAQAIATYTYINHYEQKGEYASVRSKADPPQMIIDCVEAIDGLAMFYDGKYILASYSASTAGVTCSSENVWGGERPYLLSVVNDYDHLDTKNYGRVTTYTVDEVRKKIESKTDIRLSDNYANWIQILSYADGNYVDKIAIDGHTTAEVSGKERELTAYVFRTYILSIRSTCFTVSYSDGVFTFVTYGYGHGVGMSQVGADLYAEIGGYSFDQILHHYYTGITIK